jgi:RNA 3'-terminal phosphate cyclase (ATP)
MNHNELIEIDGSQGEGGGQILRSALSLAMCTGKTVHIHQIRAKRPKPGLMRQHLACVQAAQAISGATVDGAELGSTALRFAPGTVQAGDYRFAIGSAGSCMLVLQTVLPALMQAQAPSTLKLSGGTHNPMAPTWHFIERAFAPLLARMGVALRGTLLRHGFYPAGGGDVELGIQPAPEGLTPFSLLARGTHRSALGECLVPGLARGIADRELATLGGTLGWTAAQLSVMPTRQNEGPGNALMATLVHEHVTEVFTSFGEKDVTSEQVARRLAKEVSAYLESKAPVGPHLADQLALPMALAVQASGKPGAYAASEMTAHTWTNLDVIRRFLPVKIDVSEQPDRQSGWLLHFEPAGA